MAPSSRSESSSWTRIAFLLAIGLSLLVGALIVVLLFMLLGLPTTQRGWIVTLGLALLASWIGYIALLIGLKILRGFETGVSQADNKRGQRYEDHGRRVGRFVGTGLAKVTKRTKSVPSPTTNRNSADNQSKPTMNDAARSLGMMVGRRIGSWKDRE